LDLSPQPLGDTTPSNVRGSVLAWWVPWSGGERNVPRLNDTSRVKMGTKTKAGLLFASTAEPRYASNLGLTATLHLLNDVNAFRE
jgi:hypothetical protein